MSTTIIFFAATASESWRRLLFKHGSKKATSSVPCSVRSEARSPVRSVLVTSRFVFARSIVLGGLSTDQRGAVEQESHDAVCKHAISIGMASNLLVMASNLIGMASPYLILSCFTFVCFSCITSMFVF